MVHKGIVAVLVAVCAYQAQYTIDTDRLRWQKPTSRIYRLTMGLPGWIGSRCGLGGTQPVICKECHPPSSDWKGTNRKSLNCRTFSSSTSPAGTPWQPGPLTRVLRPMTWIPLSLGFGFFYVAYLRYRYIHNREKARLASADDLNKFLASNLEVSMYKMLPLRAASRWVGTFNDVTLPKWVRPPVYGMFIRKFGCKVDEALEEDLRKYRSFSAFFRRELKEGIRPVHQGDCVVSPADGTVLHFGKVVNGEMEQVKGIKYSLSAFLGPQTWRSSDSEISSNYQNSLLTKESGSALYHLIVYLAPGDYHRFHSPADWKVSFRRHIPGHLLSVRPGLLSWIAGLFNMNERVAYVGSWKHGFFSLVAVGATNVGSIKVYCDKDLTTNCRKDKCGSHCDLSLNINNNEDVDFKKGDPFGEFNFGSTVVLIFEAPKDFKFKVEAGQKVNFGQLVSEAQKEER